MIYDSVDHSNIEQIIEDIILLLEKQYIKHLTTEPIVGYNIYNQKI